MHFWHSVTKKEVALGKVRFSKMPRETKFALLARFCKPAPCWQRMEELLQLEIQQKLESTSSVVWNQEWRAFNQISFSLQLWNMANYNYNSWSVCFVPLHTETLVFHSKLNLLCKLISVISRSGSLPSPTDQVRISFPGITRYNIKSFLPTKQTLPATSSKVYQPSKHYQPQNQNITRYNIKK